MEAIVTYLAPEAVAKVIRSRADRDAYDYSGEQRTQQQHTKQPHAQPLKKDEEIRFLMQSFARI
jgi:hypothetical protein